jgi:hypothetical protein
MRRLVYAMRFTGQVTPVGEAGGVLRAAMTALGCVLTTTIGPDGVDGALKPLPGAEVTFESEIVLTGDSSFLESGVITFGHGHRLRFTTVGSGFLGASADPSLQQGSVMLRVEGGEGQFADASGLITSNFFVGEAGEMTDHHLGVLFVRETQAAIYGAGDNPTHPSHRVAG